MVRYFILLGFALRVCTAEVGGLQSMPAVVARNNIAADSSFEAAAGNWTLTGWTANAQARKSGAYGLSFTGAGSAKATQKITVTEFRALRLRTWVKTSGGNPGPAELSMRVTCRSESGAVVNSGQGQKMALAGGRSAWTHFKLNENITWGDIHYGHVLQLEIGVSNVPAGVTVTIDDATAEPVIVPLTIYPLYPNYRGMLWPDQGLLMRWQAIAAAPRGYSLSGLRIDTEILDAAKSPIATVTAPVLAPAGVKGGLGAQWPGVSVNEQSFDASVLPDGVYYLRGKLHNRYTGSLIYTYPDYKIVKEQPAVQRSSWQSWVDKNNRAVLNGRPRFVWGSFLAPTAAHNTYVNGKSDPYTAPEPYSAIASANPPYSSSPTMLKMLQDAGMNADVYYGNLSGGNIGIGYGIASLGTIVSKGTAITGAGTKFRSDLKPGDTILVGGLAAPGAVTVYGTRAVGSGTRFTQLKRFDRIAAAGTTSAVAEIVSDTELILNEAPSGPVVNAPLAYDQVRTVRAVSSDTALTVDAPFAADIVSPKKFVRANCSSYNARYDHLSPYLEAAQAHGLWHWQITVSYHLRSSNLPTWAKHCRIDGDLLVNKLLRHTPQPLGAQPGWAGTYVADEPSADAPSEGRAASFRKARAAMDAAHPLTGRTFGGINWWVDGPVPLNTWNQWNNFMDAASTDPYPVGLGPIADDIVYGLRSGRLHGRSYWWPRRVADGQFDSRPTWTTVQLFNNGGGFPTPSDHKIQLVAALAAGSTGIFWWTPTGTMGLSGRGNPQLFQEWRASTKKFSALLPILDEPVEDLTGRLDGQAEYGRLLASVSDPAIKCSSRKLKDEVLLACANTTNVPVAATLTMAVPVASARLAWDNVSLQAAGASITLPFTGLQDAAAPAGSVHLVLIKTGQ